MKTKLDKIASTLKNAKLPKEVEVAFSINAACGEAIVVKSLESHEKYGEIELLDGRLSKVYKGDLIAGVLGERKALEGIVGIVPKTVNCGDIFHILNLGGVIGKAISWNKDVVSKPLKVKVVGSILKDNKKINIKDFSLKSHIKLLKSTQVILIAGTSMNTGKTTVATVLVHILAKEKRLKVAAAKLTGIATQRDVLTMKDAGAVKVLTFLDVGLTSTIDNLNGVVPAAKAVISKLSQEESDIIVVELGDGIAGWYGVDKLLKDQEFKKIVKFSIICAYDLAGAAYVHDFFKQINLTVDFFSGPVSNNTAGTDYLKTYFKVPAQDIRSTQDKLVKALISKGVLSV